VRAAFGAGEVAQLDGGQGTAYGDGAVVLKPVLDVVEAEWLAGVLDRLPESDDLRVIRPVRAASGAWVVDGWAGWRRLEGAPRPWAWRETLDVAERFHALVAAVPRSAALDGTHPWAVGDRVAWGEAEIAVPASLSHAMDRLQAWWRPITLTAQLAHGDLCNNVLFADGAPPAVIDVSPMWRPARYAGAIVVVDAVGWGGASDDAFESFDDEEGFQLLVRATRFRLASAVVLCVDDPARLDVERATYTRVIDLLAASR